MPPPEGLRPAERPSATMLELKPACRVIPSGWVSSTVTAELTVRLLSANPTDAIPPAGTTVGLVIWNFVGLLSESLR